MMMKAKTPLTKSKRKDSPSIEYVGVEGRIFKLEHVVGDGNCFFHSISKSPFVSANHAELRFMLVDYIEAEMVKPGNDMETLYKIFGGDHDLHHWVTALKRFGSWAGSCAAVFLCRFININIKIVTNAMKLWVVDTRMVTRSQGFFCVCDNAPTVFLYHHVYNMPFTTSDKCNHFAHMWEVNTCATIDKNVAYYGGCDVGEVVDLTITTPVTKKRKTIDLSKEEKKVSASDTLISKRKKKASAKKKKQCILSTWVIAGTGEERLKLIRMQEKNSKRSEFESKIEKFVHSQKNHPPPVIQCVKGIVRNEMSWNERTQRIYVYLHPELANKKMTIVRWAYPSLLETTFKNWLKRHDMISKWIPIIKHLKGEDVIHNVDHDAAKDKFLQFFTGKSSVDIRRYARRLKENPKVVLVGSNNFEWIWCV